MGSESNYQIDLRLDKNLAFFSLYQYLSLTQQEPTSTYPVMDQYQMPKLSFKDYQIAQNPDTLQLHQPWKLPCKQKIKNLFKKNSEMKRWRINKEQSVTPTFKTSPLSKNHLFRKQTCAVLRQKTPWWLIIFFVLPFQIMMKMIIAIQVY